MRSPLAVHAGLLGLALLGAACAPRGTPGQASTHGQPVNINISCGPNNGPVTVVVAPWTHHEAAGGSFAFRLTSSQADSVTITPKDTANWPIQPAPPVVVRAGGQSPVTIAQNATGTISYTISGSCTEQGGAATHRITIDPDIVVD